MIAYLKNVMTLTFHPNDLIVDFWLMDRTLLMIAAQYDKCFILEMFAIEHWHDHSINLPNLPTAKGMCFTLQKYHRSSPYVTCILFSTKIMNDLKCSCLHLFKLLTVFSYSLAIFLFLFDSHNQVGPISMWLVTWLFLFYRSWLDLILRSWLLT